MIGIVFLFLVLSARNDRRKSMLNEGKLSKKDESSSVDGDAPDGKRDDVDKDYYHNPKDISNVSFKSQDTLQDKTCREMTKEQYKPGVARKRKNNTIKFEDLEDILNPVGGKLPKGKSLPF